MRRVGKIRASFSGYYGMRNFGDDLFGLICHRAAARYWDADVRLVAPAIPGLQATYTMPNWYPDRYYGASNQVGQASRLYSFVRGLASADLFVLGGGSVIHSRQSFRPSLMRHARRWRGVELAAVGISIGPFHDLKSEAAAKAFLEKFSYISVRDRHSYEQAVGMGLNGQVHASRDLAGLLPILGDPRPASGRKPGNVRRIGISLCNYQRTAAYPAPCPQRLIQNLGMALQKESRCQPIEVVVVCLNEHPKSGDRQLSQQMVDLLRSRSVEARLESYVGRGPMDMVNVIADCDAFISARLHGSIVSYMENVPFCMVDYHPKCENFARDIGLAEERQLRGDGDDLSSLEKALDSLLRGGRPPDLDYRAYADQAVDIFNVAPWCTGRAFSR